MSGEPLLEARSLSLERGGRRLVSELEFEIAAGSCWGILGPNGAGKSTLLHILAGLDTPAQGEVRFRGRPVRAWKRRELARELGVLFQLEESGLASTVFEAVLSGRHPHLGALGWETARDLAIAREALQAAGLRGMEKRGTLTLSGGERQRMEIAALLAQQPRLALLDEPTNHLDPGHQLGMLRLLRARFSGPAHGLVMVLHDINLAMRFCDHLLLLRGDGSWRLGPAGEVGSEGNLSWLFRHPVASCSGCKPPCFSFL